MEDDLLKTGGAFDIAATALGIQEESLIGRKLGDYEITEYVGRGGMGLVYKAERADETFDRSVAVKVVPGGLIHEANRRRFLAERQILAGLMHQNIAQLFDAGESEEGWPYLVMEWVDGIPIDEYAAKHHLDLEARLDLCERVVEAVAFAHSQLIVHRDIKPGNILVNDNGEVKLLDFGIAKVVQSDSLSLEGDATQQFLTPRFATPEQLRGDPVMVASDVYQVGLILYLMCTDLNPQEPRAGKSDVLFDIVCTQAPELPSQVARVRQQALSRDGKELSGDIDHIIMQCLRKDPAERYPTAEALLRDLQAHRKNLPLLYAQSDFIYRSKKWLLRNKVPVSLTAMFSVLIATSSAWYIDSIKRERAAVQLANENAQREAAVATSMTDFLLNMITSADLVDSPEKPPLVTDAILIGAKELQSGLQDQPVVRARLAAQLSNALVSNQEFAAARELLVPVTADVKQNTEIEFDLRATLLERSAYALYRQSDFDGARREFLQLLEWHEQEQQTSAPTYADIFRNLGLLERRAMNFDQSVEYMARANELYDVEKVHPFDMAVFYGNYALVLTSAKKHDEALAFYEKSTQILLDEQGLDSPRVAINLVNVAMLYTAEERFEEALDSLNRADAIFRERAGGPYGVREGSVNVELATLYQKMGRYEDAIAAHNRATEIFAEQLGTEHSLYALSLFNHGNTLKLYERCDLALPLYREARKIHLRLFGEDSEWIAREDDRIAQCENAVH